MQRKRGELVPIGEVFSDLGGPVKAIREASPQAQHHFTLADQVDQLVRASETTPDLGFMARLLALCSLPRSNPGNRLQYKRVNGPFTLYMTVTGGNKLLAEAARAGAKLWPQPLVLSQGALGRAWSLSLRMWENWQADWKEA